MLCGQGKDSRCRSEVTSEISRGEKWIGWDRRGTEVLRRECVEEGQGSGVLLEVRTGTRRVAKGR